MASIQIESEDLQKLIEDSVHHALSNVEHEEKAALSSKAKEYAVEMLKDNCNETVFDGLTKNLIERGKDVGCTLIGTLLDLLIRNLLLTLILVVSCVVLISLVTFAVNFCKHHDQQFLHVRHTTAHL